MNGEMYQIVALVAAGKRALKNHCGIEYTKVKYENSITFSFLPRKGAKEYMAPDVNSWFSHLKKIGVQDLKMLCPGSVENRALLGFSNVARSMILCFFQDGSVTYFLAQWEFDSVHKEWNIYYTEQEWKNPPEQKPHFEKNEMELRLVLENIFDLAEKIGEGYFANVFASAIQLLDGIEETMDQRIEIPLPQIPEENLRILKAADRAYVFGGMGSWNDSPPYMAEEKGLEKEYNNLSDELLKNVRLAILYAVNEW